eukprot:Selendium_serpulae@DN2825_c0_g1_i1.p1
MRRKAPVVFVCSEVAPWYQVGGLGEVMHFLPVALAAKGHRVMTISPRYSESIGADTGSPATIYINGNEERFDVFHFYDAEENVDRVFLSHPVFNQHAEHGHTHSVDDVYGPAFGVDWSSNAFAFASLCRAALEVIKCNPFGGVRYGEDSVIIANDWHTAPMAALVAYQRETFSAWKKAKVIQLIHNIRFDGAFPYDLTAALLGLPDEYMAALLCKDKECVLWLRGGIRYADKLLTVSPCYAANLLGGRDPGDQHGLAADLRAAKGTKRALVGISHGTHVTVARSGIVCPSNARFLSVANEVGYTTHLLKKPLLKKALQEFVNLPQDDTATVFLYVGGMDPFQGVDVLINCFHWLLPDENIQLVLCGGHGRDDLADRAYELRNRFPHKVAFSRDSVNSDVTRSRFFAGADWIVFPCRSEPCSLLHLEAMKYGTLPLATDIDGFSDTISHMRNGMMIEEEFEPFERTTDRSIEVLKESIINALRVQGNAQAFLQMQRMAMDSASEHTWGNTADVYSSVFEELARVGESTKATKRASIKASKQSEQAMVGG